MEGYLQLSCCAYHVAQDMSNNAQLVFYPYNYINSIIQRAMKLDIEGVIRFSTPLNILIDMFFVYLKSY